MDRTPWIALAVACVIASGPSQADPLNNNPRLPGMDRPAANISPVFHELVVFTLPAHFKAVYEKTNGSFYIREHVPEGESDDHWTRMITLTGTRDLAANPSVSPRAFIETIAAGFRRHCPDTYAAAALGPQTVGGGSEGFAVIASCGRVQSGNESHSETAMMLAFKGSADYYTIQWAERGSDSAQPLTPDTAYWSKRIAQLGPIRLCPIVPGEPAPYVSCVGQ